MTTGSENGCEHPYQVSIGGEAHPLEGVKTAACAGHRGASRHRGESESATCMKKVKRKLFFKTHGPVPLITHNKKTPNTATRPQLFFSFFCCAGETNVFSSSRRGSGAISLFLFLFRLFGSHMMSHLLSTKTESMRLLLN